MGFPHSEIFGSKCAGNSPKLIAACHVLHRLSVPRHPPNALVVLDFTTLVSEATILRSPHRLVPCRGRPPPRQRPCLPIPSTLPRRQSEEYLDFQTSSDERCQRTIDATYAARSSMRMASWPSVMMVEADGIEPTTSCLQSRRSPN
jgi:hypothetical protein